jgi:hypothetical protein
MNPSFGNSCVGKGDTTASENIKLNGSSLHTQQLAEKITASMQKHCLNGDKVAEDVKAGKALLFLISSEVNDESK